jgi:hypothetical protein
MVCHNYYYCNYGVCPSSTNLKRTQQFGNCVYFRPHMKKWGVPTHLDLLVKT